MGSIFMFKRKVSSEEKITAVESYLNGDRQLHTILEQYGIAKESFRTWVRNYQIFGGEGLRDKYRKASYSAQTQTAAVKDYLSGAGSQADICKKYKIYSRSQLQSWIKMYPISETLVENYFCFFICLLDRERFKLPRTACVFCYSFLCISILRTVKPHFR